MAQINRVSQSQRALLMDGSALLEINSIGDLEGYRMQLRASGGGGAKIPTTARESMAAWLRAKDFCYDPGDIQYRPGLENACFFSCIALEIL